MLSYKYIYNYRSSLSQGQFIHETEKQIYLNKWGELRIQCTDPEWNFFKKYGLANLYVWREMNSSEREELNKVIKLYQEFWSLYYEHYEDLCLYAIMFRNVHISPTMADVMSVRFFVSEADEIKGFKKHLKKNQPRKAEVALLYFHNKTIFSKVFNKYLHEEIELKPGYEDSYGYKYNTFYEMCKVSKNIVSDFSKGFSPIGVGIHNLSNHDCSEILKLKNELLDEYNKAYEETLKKSIIEEKGVSYSRKFFTSKFIPYYGRISTKTATSHNRVYRAKITPVLDSDSKDEILSRHEYFIVSEWCRTLKEKYDAIRKEEEEKWEKQRQIELEKERIIAEQRLKEEEARREKFRYNQRNRHYRDSNISFDESSHTYIVNGETLQSVTTLVKNSFPQFEAEAHAKYHAAKTGKTIKEILDMWETKGKESRDLGTALHKKIENYYQGFTLNESDESFKLFKMFAEKIKLEPYRTEWTVYDWEHKIAGTIDFVDYQNGEYIIYDWKRSDKLIANDMPVKINMYHEKGNYPLEHLDNSSYYHYALQLSIYKYILEKNYGIKISDLRLGVFHPTYKKPYVLKMPYLEKETNDIFNLRSEVIF